MAEDLFEIPTLCPVCSGPTAERGDFLYCVSESCPSRLSGSVKVWVRNLGLLHIGEATIDSLTAGDPPAIGSIADLYRLSVEDWALHCSGMKMAAKCHAALHGNKELPLELVVSSLNIPNFGLSTATDLVQGGIDTAEKMLAADFEALKSVQNVGDITARQIQEGLLSKRDILLDVLTVVSLKAPIAVGPLVGKTMCITEATSVPRKALEKRIMDAGGIPKGSVSKTTSYLVTNYPDATTSKMVAAKKHGVPVISEADLVALLDGKSS
jgi:NAD-dependent DNA ligase